MTTASHLRRVWLDAPNAEQLGRINPERTGDRVERRESRLGSSEFDLLEGLERNSVLFQILLAEALLLA